MMKRLITVVCSLLVAIFMIVPASANMKRTAVELTDIPESSFEIIRYESPTKAMAMSLDVPDDGIPVTVFKGYVDKETLGTTTPQQYFDDFKGTPHVYRFEDKETGKLLGFLVISPRLRFLSRYKRNIVSIQLEDPHYVPNR
jgi:hypothetical protein